MQLFLSFPIVKQQSLLEFLLINELGTWWFNSNYLKWLTLFSLIINNVYKNSSTGVLICFPNYIMFP